MFVNFFPPTHPYNWPIIGYVEDLDRATLEDMRDWLKRWYGPNNATLVISGDVNTKEVIALANKYFSGIPRGESVRKMRKQPVRLSSDIYTSYIEFSIENDGFYWFLDGFKPFRQPQNSY